MRNNLLCAHDIATVLSSRLLAQKTSAKTSSHGIAENAEKLFSQLSAPERIAFAQEAAYTFCVPHSVPHPSSVNILAEHIDQQWHDYGYMVCFHSSGTTGTPVAHRYSMAILLEEAQALAPLFTDCQRIVSVMPSHHIFGFVFSIILPKVLDVPVLRLPPLPTVSFFANLRPADMVLAFPFFWQSLLILLQQPHSDLYLPAQVSGISSTAPCPPEVIEGLSCLSRPLAHITEIYGSTETSGIGYRRNPHHPYTLLSVWRRLTQGKETVIQRVLPAGMEFPPQPMPDEMLWVDSTHFFPQKRKDYAVQVGGINVYPQQIAACIETHPAVQQCAVRLMQPEEGARLKAFIVPDPILSQKEIKRIFGLSFRQWLAARLETAARPKSITLGSQLPRNSMGKLADWPAKKRYPFRNT